MRQVLVTVFFLFSKIFYPVLLFEDKKIRMAGAAIGAVMVIGLTAYGLMNPPVYSAEIMSSNEKHSFDDTCQVSLADESYGSVKIIYEKSIETYMIQADFRHAGETVLTVETLDGGEREYDLVIRRDTYEVSEVK